MFADNDDLINECIRRELVLVETVHGDTFASPQELVGVLKEEIDECTDEIHQITHSFEYFYKSTRVKSPNKDDLEEMKKAARFAIKELFQVIAVCEKGENSGFCVSENIKRAEEAFYGNNK